MAALVKALWLARGLSQEAVARQFDVSLATVNAWENGRHRPITSLARRLQQLSAEAEINRRPTKKENYPVNAVRVARRSR